MTGVRAKIVLLPGDGIGPEVVREARRGARSRRARASATTFEFDEQLIGGGAIDATRHRAARTRALTACQAARRRAARRGRRPQVGRPDGQGAARAGPAGASQGAGAVRQPPPGQAPPSARRRVAAQARDARGRGPAGAARADRRHLLRRKTREELPAAASTRHRHARVPRRRDPPHRASWRSASPAAGAGKVTSVDKANVLETSRLWRQIADRGRRGSIPDIALEHMLVDSARDAAGRQPRALRRHRHREHVRRHPDRRSRGAGRARWACCPRRRWATAAPGLYEPIHGSAPDIAGKGIANPLGTILSVAMLLRHSLELEREAAAIEQAVDRAITDGCRTRDLGGRLTTTAMTDEIIRRLG